MTPLPRRTWLEVLLVGGREVRATGVAFATIWSLLFTTGFIDRIWPTEAVATSAVVEEAPSGALVAAPLPDAIEQFEPVEIAPDALVMDCPFEGGCDGVGKAWIDADGEFSAIGVPVAIERGKEPPRPTPREVIFTNEEVIVPGPEPLEVGEEVIVISAEQDSRLLALTIGTSILVAIGAALIWRRLRIKRDMRKGEHRG